MIAKKTVLWFSRIGFIALILIFMSGCVKENELVIRKDIQVADSFEISVDPNPCTFGFYVYVTGIEEGIVHCELMDIIGKVRYSQDRAIDRTGIYIDLSGVESGLYLLRVQSGDRVQHKRVVKQ